MITAIPTGFNVNLRELPASYQQIKPASQQMGGHCRAREAGIKSSTASAL
jgi:hypothetical protein